MRMSAIRNVLVLLLVTVVVIWLGYSDNDVSLIVIPLVIGVGAHLCTGHLAAQAAYAAVPLVALAPWWLPQAYRSPDPESLFAVGVSFSTWLPGTLFFFLVIAAGKYAWLRYIGGGGARRD